MPFNFANSFDSLDSVEAVERQPVEDVVPVRTTWGLLSDCASAAPRKTAVRHLAAPDRAPEDWRFERLRSAALQIANVFRALGVRRMDAVAFLTLTSPTALAAIYGAQACAIACAINPFLNEEAIAAILAESGAKVLLVDGPDGAPAIYEKLPGVMRRLAQAPKVLHIEDRPDGESSLMQQMSRQPRDRAAGWTEPNEHDICAYYHTGGTTGFPKLARHTHRAQAIAAWLCAYALGIRSSDTVACGMPLFHVGGALACTLGPLACGATLLQMGPMGYRDRPFVEQFWPLVDQYGVSVVIAVPTTHAQTLELHRPGQGSSLRVVCGGATALPDALVQRYADKTGHVIRNPWGLTEATLAVSMTPSSKAVQPGSAGIRMPFIEIEAREVLPSGGGRQLPAGESGLLFVRGPTVFAGFLHPEANRGVIAEDGWLCTGDLGRIEADGTVYLMGRAKDLIIRGGHNLDPSMIEEAIAHHPAVADCAAIGFPDPRVGELPAVFVSLRPGARCDADDLLRYAREAIAEPAAVPKHVFFLDALPQTAVGKTFKPALRLLATEHAIRGALAGIDCAVNARMDARRGLVVQVIASLADASVVNRRLTGYAMSIEVRTW